MDVTTRTFIERKEARAARKREALGNYGMNQDKSAKVNEPKILRANKWVTLVKDEQTFGDKKWRAAIGRNLMPIEPCTTEEEIREALKKWPDEEQMDVVAWFTTMIAQTNMTNNEK